MRKVLHVAIGIAAVSALTLAGCSSSGSRQAKAVVARAPAADAVSTTTTQPGAIGLRTNADERAELVPDKTLTKGRRAALASQLITARATAALYPTVADALKAGLVQAGEFTPGAGAHYVSVGGSVGGTSSGGAVDAVKPEGWIYDGTSPTSRVVGLMYASFSMNPPDGFAGPNDHWHRHTNLCIVYGTGKIGIPYPPDSDVTKAQCDTKHGQFMHQTFWMLHAWVVPAWESPQGVFSHANIDLHCGDGTDQTDAVGFCKGS
jgi:hypothetical protein